MIGLSVYAGSFFQKDLRISTQLNEELSNRPLSVDGKIPAWLTGTLVRNGPIRVAINNDTNKHWFDGLAMLHSFSIANTRVDYTNKFLRTEAYNKVFKEGSLNYLGFETEPSKSVIKRLFTWFKPKKNELHNANINVGKLANEYVAYTEIPLPVRFDLENVETLGVFEYTDSLPKNDCWECAHPHPDVHQKETINYLIEFSRNSFYTVYKIADGSSERKLIAKIPVDKPSYMHSFSITENYVIFTEYPYVVKPFEIITSGLPFIENYKWLPEQDTRFTVVNRKTGEVTGTYHTRPFFSFHHTNAFEQDGKIYIDMVCYPDAKVIGEIASHFEPTSQENKDKSSNPFKVTFERFEIANGKVSSDVLLNASVEFPRINSNYDGRPYRYAYLADPRDADNDPYGIRPIYKVDTKTKKTLVWSEQGCYPGEPVFVPAPDAKDEDDGVVLTVVLNLDYHDSFLLVLDGKTFREIARARVPHVIPAGLHGQFFR